MNRHRTGNNTETKQKKASPTTCEDSVNYDWKAFEGPSGQKPRTPSKSKPDDTPPDDDEDDFQKGGIHCTGE